MSQNHRVLNILMPLDLGEASQRDMEFEGRAVDRAQESAARVLANVFADTCYELLPDWERVYGLPSDPELSTGVRVATLVAKIRARGGLSRPYFINLAHAMGYQIQIDEPTEFMAGWSYAGDEVNGEDIVYVWWVDVLNENIPAFFFHAGGCGAGDRLCDFGQDDFEAIFQDLKPAETQVFFSYPNYQE